MIFLFYFHPSSLVTFPTSFSGRCLSTWSNASFVHNLALSFFYLQVLRLNASKYLAQCWMCVFHHDFYFLTWLLQQLVWLVGTVIKLLGFTDSYDWSLVVLLTDSSTPNSQVVEAFSLCMFLFCTFYQTLPSGSPCSKQQGHRLQAHHKIRCLWDPGRGMTRTQFQCWFHLCIYYKSITGSLYAALGQRVSPGAPDLLVGLGWLQRSTQHGMCGGVLALLEDSLSVGAAPCSALYC